MSKLDISREDMMAAVTEGVRQAFDEHLVDAGSLFNAIRHGVRDAIWQMITNATDMPCADFYDSVKEGVAEGMRQVGPDIA